MMRFAALLLIGIGDWPASAQAQTGPARVEFLPMPDTLPTLLFAPDPLAGTHAAAVPDPQPDATAISPEVPPEPATRGDRRAAAALRRRRMSCPMASPRSRSRCPRRRPPVAAIRMRRSRTRSPRRLSPLSSPRPRRRSRLPAPRREPPRQATTVTVIVENVEISDGQRQCRGLRQGPEPRGLPLRPRGAGRSRASWRPSSTDIPPGTYAVVGYHDVNGNDQFDKLLGMPREPYALSSKAGEKLVPTFADAALTIKRARTPSSSG